MIIRATRAVILLYGCGTTKVDHSNPSGTKVPLDWAIAVQTHRIATLAHRVNRESYIHKISSHPMDARIFDVSLWPTKLLQDAAQMTDRIGETNYCIALMGIDVQLSSGICRCRGLEHYTRREYQGAGNKCCTDESYDAPRQRKCLEKLNYLFHTNLINT